MTCGRHLMSILLQISWRVRLWKNFENRSTFDAVVTKTWWFFDSWCIADVCCCFLWNICVWDCVRMRKSFHALVKKAREACRLSQALSVRVWSQMKRISSDRDRQRTSLCRGRAGRHITMPRCVDRWLWTREKGWCGRVNLLLLLLLLLLQLLHISTSLRSSWVVDDSCAVTVDDRKLLIAEDCRRITEVTSRNSH